ncbi:hypothetical protein HF086_017330 [Spodoptera exigua]|uniref:E3 ubiquitin-protein ligase n=1 Tax=Spodoptera exigua TaxID=7107 RepID=A0A922S8S7_SPOEX|nr:hypothetical protein HF086_017330 [Spodoptera exigua]
MCGATRCTPPAGGTTSTTYRTRRTAGPLTRTRLSSTRRGAPPGCPPAWGYSRTPRAARRLLEELRRQRTGQGEPQVCTTYSDADAGASSTRRGAPPPAGLGLQPHVSSWPRALHAACWRNYVDNVQDKENRRSLLTRTRREQHEAWRAAWLPAGLGLQPHVSSCGHALHAACWRNYVDNVQDKENRRRGPQAWRAVAARRPGATAACVQLWPRAARRLLEELRRQRTGRRSVPLTLTRTRREQHEAWRAAWLPAGLGLQPHVSSCGHALHAACWRNYVDNVQDKENRRSVPLTLTRTRREQHEAWRAAWLPAGLGLQPHVSSCGHALHAACWRNYVDNVQDKENRRSADADAARAARGVARRLAARRPGATAACVQLPYRGRQPAAFDVEKKEYLCPLCERLCNTALPLLPAPSIPVGTPPPLTEESYNESVSMILKLKHQVSSEALHICTEFCEEMHCQARARSVGAMSSDMEDGELADETEVYVSTHAENLLKPDFLVHFDAEIPPYNDMTKTLIEDFANILPISEYGGMVSSAALYRSTSYTILSTNAVLQAENRPLLGELPARHRDTLQALIRLAAALPSVWSSPKHLSHHALSTLNTLESTSPLSHEPFGTLVALVLTAPCLFCKAGGPARPTNLAKQITLQCLRATITRALLVTDLTTCRSEPMEGQEDFKNADLENLLPLIKELRNGILEDCLNPTEVWQLIQGQCHTFLRCCCLFYHFLSDISAPSELTVVGGDTWESLCGYLDMPTTFKELVDTPSARKKIMEWVGVSTEWFTGEIPPHVVTEPKEPPSLIPLPEDFSELMNLVSEFSCPNSEREDSKKPTMCLVCGQILCSQSYCRNGMDNGSKSDREKERGFNVARF